MQEVSGGARRTRKANRDCEGAAMGAFPRKQQDRDPSQ